MAPTIEMTILRMEEERKGKGTSGLDGATLVVILLLATSTGPREGAPEARVQGHRSSAAANPPGGCQSETAWPDEEATAWSPGGVGGSIRLVLRADAVPSVDQVSAQP